MILTANPGSSPYPAPPPRPPGRLEYGDGRERRQPRAQRINEAHRKATEAGRSMLEWAIEAGRELLEVKRGLPHGQFQDWCRANLSFGDRHARKYMQLAKSATHGRFDPEVSIRGALEALAEPRQSAPKALDASTALRIHKLAALANSDNEHEAEVAQAMLDKLADRFGMTGEEVHLQDP